MIDLDQGSWTCYEVPGIHTLVYSCYDITDKDTWGHLVINKGNITWAIHIAEM